VVGFYVGSYFVAGFSTPVQQDWLFPDNLEHARETSNVEELNINPEDIDLFPLEVQAGACSYTEVTFSTVDEFYVSTSPALGGFYISSVSDNEGFYILLVGN
jgi:hypothetical protein